MAGKPKVTPALEKLMIDLRGRGETLPAIAKTVGLSYTTVQRVLGHQVAKERIEGIKIGVALDKQALRERQKEIIMRRAEKVSEQAFDLVETTLLESDAKGFANAMQGIEKLDKVSGNSVGEGTRVIHEGAVPQAPQVELKLLIQQVLGR